MYTHIYQNSYVVAFIVFVVLAIIFRLFEIGYNTSIKNGKVMKTFSWKYPLAIALMVWLFWNYYLYPESDVTKASPRSMTDDGLTNEKLSTQKINISNWN
jgi:hypothetical protein